MFLFSCSSINDLEKHVTGYNAPEKANGEGFDNVKYNIIGLEKNKQIVLVSPKKIEIADSIIYILDDNKVVSYNSEGKYLCSIGHRGHGHNEYLNLSTFYIDDKNNVVLYDSYKNTLLRYSKNGKFIDKKTLSTIDLKYAQSIIPVDEESIFVYNFLYNDFNQLCRTVNVNDEKENAICSVPLRTDNTMERVGNNPCSIYKGNGTIRYVRPFDNKIYNLNDNSALCIETSEKIMSEKDMVEIKDYSVSTYAECLNSGIFTGFTDIFETKRYLLLACHNFSYTLIDKEHMKCQKYYYDPKTTDEKIPLYNIKGAFDDKLIGLLSIEDLKELSSSETNRITKDLNKVVKDNSFDYAVIIYDMEKTDLF